MENLRPDVLMGLKAPRGGHSTISTLRRKLMSERANVNDWRTPASGVVGTPEAAGCGTRRLKRIPDGVAGHCCEKPPVLYNAEDSGKRCTRRTSGRRDDPTARVIDLCTPLPSA